MFAPYLLYFLGINLLTYLLMYADKRAAMHGRSRIPEVTFYGLGCLFGALGLLLASRSFRHKTQKQPFRTISYAIFALNILLLYVLIPYLRAKF